MIGLILLALLSLSGVAVAVAVPGWSDLMLLAGPCALASLLLLARANLRRSKDRQGPAPKWIVVDGSNVMYWRDETPRIETVQDVVRHLSSLGFTTGVMFDANAGYLISDRYRHDGDLGRMLQLPEERVMVVPKGTPADPYILAAARDLGAQIVTNDRFRDWVEKHPEIGSPGVLIRGGYRSGQLWLDLDTV